MHMHMHMHMHNKHVTCTPVAMPFYANSIFSRALGAAPANTPPGGLFGGGLFGDTISASGAQLERSRRAAGISASSAQFSNLFSRFAAPATQMPPPPPFGAFYPSAPVPPPQQPHLLNQPQAPLGCQQHSLWITT